MSQLTHLQKCHRAAAGENGHGMAAAATVSSATLPHMNSAHRERENGAPHREREHGHHQHHQQQQQHQAYRVVLWELGYSENRQFIYLVHQVFESAENRNHKYL